MKQIEIGQTFEHGGKEFIAVKSDSTCYGCAFFEKNRLNCNDIQYACWGDERGDKKNVIFVLKEDEDEKR